MVARKRHALGAGFALWMALASPSARADSILEKMQNEIAAIAESIRNAVVSIEDERNVMFSDAPYIFYTPLTKAQDELLVLDGDVAQQEAQKQALDKELATVQERVKVGQAPQAELDSVKARWDQARIALETAHKRRALRQQSLEELGAANFLSELSYPEVAGQKRVLADKLKSLEARLTEALKSKGNEANLNTLRTEQKSLMAQLNNLARRTARPDKYVFSNRIQQATGVGVGRTGSGFCIGEGYVVTTSDVLAGMKNPIIVTDGGARIKAQVIGSNIELNIGLLKLAAKADIPGLKLGDSSGVKAGHFAISLGNQAGQPNSVTLTLVGNVRTGGTYAGNQFYPGLIQIAGTVGAGTSGAPLVNVRGEVIGMMAAIPVTFTLAQSYVAPSGGATREADPVLEGAVALPALPVPGVKVTETAPKRGQSFFGNGFGGAFHFEGQPSVTSAGFAIPSNQIRLVVDELRSDKPIVRGWIGIAPEDVVKTSEKEGILQMDRTVRIVGVYPDSPAYAVGVQPGDIILRLNEKPVLRAADIREASVRLRKGEVMSLTLRRGKEQRKIILKIDARPATIKPPITEPLKESF